MAIVCKSQSEIDKMRQSGHIVRQILDELKAMVAPGVTTMDLEKAAEKKIGEAPTRGDKPAGGCTIVRPVPAGPRYRPRRGRMRETPRRQRNLPRSFPCRTVPDHTLRFTLPSNTTFEGRPGKAKRTRLPCLPITTVVTTAWPPPNATLAVRPFTCTEIATGSVAAGTAYVPVQAITAARAGARAPRRRPSRAPARCARARA